MNTEQIQGAKMNIEEIKKKLLSWRDFYGQDITDIDLIKAITTKADVRKVLEKHRVFLEYQATDASTDIDNTERKLGIY